MTLVLQFHEIACVRGGRLLFERLDLALAPGAAVHVTGLNGSGKSSLIRLAAGLLRPAFGTIERSAPAALADESAALDCELPLRQALRFWGGDVDRSMAALGLTPLAAVPVQLLSTGQAKRAALARVAASAARLWLLDEPANGLDTESLGLLAELIAGHRSSGGAVLAASHSELPGEWRTLALGS